MSKSGDIIVLYLGSSLGLKKEAEMKQRRSPCIMAVYKHGPLGDCHCGTETDILADLWYDLTFAQKLQAEGINQEYAARLTIEKSVKHQRKAESTPFQRVHNCPLQAASYIDMLLNKKGMGYAQLLSWTLFPSNTLILFDRNETIDDAYPSIVMYINDDIRSFLCDYEEHPEKFFSLHMKE